MDSYKIKYIKDVMLGIINPLPEDFSEDELELIYIAQEVIAKLEKEKMEGFDEAWKIIQELRSQNG